MGSPAVLARDAEGPRSIAVDGTSVYWSAHGPATTNADGKIMKVALGGGTPVILAGGLTEPDAIAVDKTNVYFTTRGGPGDVGFDQGSVGRVPIAGGAVTVLASGQKNPGAIAVDSNFVYWTNLGTGSSDDTGTGAIMRVPIAGGTPTAMASNLPSPRGLALDALYAYWKNGIVSNAPSGPLAKSIVKVPFLGGEPTSVANAGSESLGPLVDGAALYWIDDKLEMAPLAGEAPVDYAVNARGTPRGIAQDEATLYILTAMVVAECGGSATLSKIAKNGGTRVDIASWASGYVEPAVQPIAVDGASVYFTSPEQGAILKIAK
jgi:hypothetical protein